MKILIGKTNGRRIFRQSHFAAANLRKASLLPYMTTTTSLQALNHKGTGLPQMLTVAEKFDELIGYTSAVSGAISAKALNRTS